MKPKIRHPRNSGRWPDIPDDVRQFLKDIKLLIIEGMGNGILFRFTDNNNHTSWILLSKIKPYISTKNFLQVDCVTYVNINYITELIDTTHLKQVKLIDNSVFTITEGCWAGYREKKCQIRMIVQLAKEKTVNRVISRFRSKYS